MLPSRSRTCSIRLRRCALHGVSAWIVQSPSPFSLRRFSSSRTNGDKNSGTTSRLPNHLEHTTAPETKADIPNKDLSRPERPRRVRVRRSDQRSKELSSGTPSVTSEASLGRLRSRPRRNNVFDSNQQLMLSFHGGAQNRSDTVDGSLAGKQATSESSPQFHLPTLHAAALLDSQYYCIKSANAATSKSGTEASRRLLRGKKSFLTLVRKLVGRQDAHLVTALQDGRRLPLGPQAYILSGHGIPQQLLQDHVELAGTLLRRLHVGVGETRMVGDGSRGRFSSQSSLDCSIQFWSHLNGAADASSSASSHTYHASSLTSDYQPPYQVDWMQVRQQQGGGRGRSKATTTSTQTLAVPESCRDPLQLYLVVMHRLARKLGSVIVGQTQSSARDDLDSVTPNNMTNVYPCSPKAWKALFSHEQHPQGWNWLSAGGDALSFTWSSVCQSGPLVLVRWPSSSTFQLSVCGCMDTGSLSLARNKNGPGIPRLRRRRVQRPRPVILSFEAVY